MKKFLLLTSCSLALITGAVFNSAENTKTVKAETLIDDRLDIQSLFVDNGSIDQKALPTTPVNIGDGKYGTATFNKGESSNVPDIHLSGSTYILRFKYCNNYSTAPDGTLGAYVQFDANEGYAIKHISWPSMHYTSDTGYSLQIFDDTTETYEVFQEEDIKDGESRSFDFVKSTKSIRLYHRWYLGWSKRNLFGIDNYINFKFEDISNSTHTITFDSRGGDHVNSKVFALDELTVAPINPAKKPDSNYEYEFVGWYADENCTDGNEFVFGNTLNENIVLFAKWNAAERTHFTISTNLNKTASNYSIGSSATFSVTNSSMDIELYRDSETTDSRFKLVLNGNGRETYLRNYSPDSYLYLHYGSDKEFTGSSIDIIPLEPMNPYYITSFKLYDVGTSGKVSTTDSISYRYWGDDNVVTSVTGGCFKSGVFEINDLPFGIKYVQIYCDIYTSNSKEYIKQVDVSYLKVSSNSYTVTFDPLNGSNPIDIINSAGKASSKPADPVKESEIDASSGIAYKFVFDGWYFAETGNEKYNFDVELEDGTILYAHYQKVKAESYRLSFNTNGGTAIPDQLGYEGFKFTKPENPTKESTDERYAYEFDNWYTDSGLLNQYDFESLITNDLVLYASWNKVHSELPNGVITINEKSRKLSEAPFNIDDNNGNSWNTIAERDCADTDCFSYGTTPSFINFKVEKINPNAIGGAFKGKITEGSYGYSEYDFGVGNAKVTISLVDENKVFTFARQTFVSIQGKYSTNPITLTAKDSSEVLSQTEGFAHKEVSSVQATFNPFDDVRSISINVPYVDVGGGRIQVIGLEKFSFCIENRKQAFTYIESFLGANVCGLTDNDGLQNDIWNEQAEIFGNLDAENKGFLRNIDVDNNDYDQEVVDFITKYERVVSLHGLEFDFMNRAETRLMKLNLDKTQAQLFDSIETKLSSIAIVLVLLFGGAVGLAGFVKKSKFYK